MNEYKNLILAHLKETDKNIEHQIDKLKDEDSLKYAERWLLNKRTSYKGNFEERKQKIINAIEKKYEKENLNFLIELKTIAEAEPLKNDLVITVEWNKSRTWGANPKAFDNFSNESDNIGGCGYDKLSTATAQILNQHKYLIKLMCDVKEKSIKDLNNLDNNKIHRDVLGYGSGYGIIPKFEGGVGVGCHLRILEKLGYNARQISSGKTTDVFLITKMVTE